MKTTQTCTYIYKPARWSQRNQHKRTRKQKITKRKQQKMGKKKHQQEQRQRNRMNRKTNEPDLRGRHERE
jgi:hypothetical protein